jgi:hypothetical protein
MNKNISKIECRQSNLSIPTRSISIHELIKNIKQLTLWECIIFYFPELLQRTIRTVLHENVVIVGWETLQREHFNKIWVFWQCFDWVDLLLNSIFCSAVWVRYNFDCQKLVWFVVLDGLSHGWVFSLPKSVLIAHENKKLSLLLIMMVGNDKLNFFMHEQSGVLNNELCICYKDGS